MLYRVMVFFTLVIAVRPLFLVVLLVSHRALVAVQNGVAHLVLEHGVLGSLPPVVACERPQIRRLCSVVQRSGLQHLVHLGGIVAVERGLGVIAAHIRFVRHGRFGFHSRAGGKKQSGCNNYCRERGCYDKRGFSAARFNGKFSGHNFPFPPIYR